MPRLNDPRFVRDEYRVETGLAARSALYRFLPSDAVDPRQLALKAISECHPRRVLEVGCGRGEFAERVMRELPAQLVAIDLSERMVELTRQRGVDAQLGDVQSLPFHNGEFDCVAALWVLYHVPDLERGLGEIVRVMRPGGRLVATTSGMMHLHELNLLLGAGPAPSTFSRENGEPILRRTFAGVDRYDVDDWFTVPNRQPLIDYAQSSRHLRDLASKIPLTLPVPFRIRRAVSMFVAETSLGMNRTSDRLESIL